MINNKLLVSSNFFDDPDNVLKHLLRTATSFAKFCALFQLLYSFVYPSLLILIETAKKCSSFQPISTNTNVNLTIVGMFSS